MSGLKSYAQTRNFVSVINGSRVQQSTTTTAADVYGSQVYLLPGECEDGLVLRWTVAGTLTGGNAAFTLKLYLDSTLLQTMTSDAATAGDWFAMVTMYCAGGAVEKIGSTLLLDTEDPDVQFDAGTTSLQNGGTLKLVITSGNSGDTVTSDMCFVERFLIP